MMTHQRQNKQPFYKVRLKTPWQKKRNYLNPGISTDRCYDKHSVHPALTLNVLLFHSSEVMCLEEGGKSGLYNMMWGQLSNFLIAQILLKEAPLVAVQPEGYFEGL